MKVLNHSGRYTCKTYIGKSVKVAGESKQNGLMRNTNCRERQNLFHVIDIGCIFNKIADLFVYQRPSLIVSLKRYCNMT